MDIEKKEAFSNAINKCEVVHIFMHDHPSPDPDCLSTSIALAKLLKEKFHKSSSIYGIPVNHRMNAKMVSELEINFIDPRQIASNDISNKDAVILVDCTMRSGTFRHTECLKGREDIFPSWVIDHHPDKESSADLHVDLQPVGSCATIITEYLQEFGVEFNVEDSYDKSVATALMLGLMVDTKNLLSDDVDKKRDINAFVYLKDRYDQTLYADIMNYDYPVHFYENMQLAYSNKHVAEPFAILNLGFLKEERLGSIPHIADYWIRRERITAVTVFAVNGKEIIASVRTKDGCPYKASEIAKLLFPNGSAGGKRDSAGATVVVNGFWDLDSLDNEGKESFIKLTMATLVNRFKKIIDLDE